MARAGVEVALGEEHKMTLLVDGDDILLRQGDQEVLIPNEHIADLVAAIQYLEN